MPISRQRKYQIKHKVLGLCILCPKLIYKLDYCVEHYKKQLGWAKIYGMRKRREAGIPARKTSKCSLCNHVGHNKATCLMEKGNDN